MVIYFGLLTFMRIVRAETRPAVRNVLTVVVDFKTGARRRLRSRTKERLHKIKAARPAITLTIRYTERAGLF